MAIDMLPRPEKLPMIGGQFLMAPRLVQTGWFDFK